MFLLEQNQKSIPQQQEESDYSPVHTYSEVLGG